VYAVGELDQSRQLEAQALALSKKSGLHLLRAGRAFALIRGKLKGERRWMQWLRANGLAHSTINQAIQVYERLRTEEAVNELTIGQVKERAGIIRPTKPSKRKIAADVPDHRTVKSPTAKAQTKTVSDHQITDPPPGDPIQLHHCRFQELTNRAGITPGSVDLVLTDVP
jgi:hypothetical protein